MPAVTLRLTRFPARGCRCDGRLGFIAVACRGLDPLFEFNKCQ